MKSKYMNIIDKIMIGQNKFLAIVEIYNKYYLVSITEKDTTIINEIENFQPLPYIKPDSNLEFHNILNKFLKR